MTGDVPAPPVRPRARAAAPALGLLLALFCAWAGGFAWFVYAARRPGPPAPPADGIVALTGGADRVETALRLLAQGRAPRLLISGVARGVDLDDLARRVRVAPDAPEGEAMERAMSGRVTLGRAASTVGNAVETAVWARAHGLRSLLVVTAGYHMPRALLEIGRALPGVVLYPVPVQPPALRGAGDLGTTRLLAVEYTKLLAAHLGLARLHPGELPQGEPLQGKLLRGAPA